MSERSWFLLVIIALLIVLLWMRGTTAEPSQYHPQTYHTMPSYNPMPVESSWERCMKTQHSAFADSFAPCK